MSPSTTDTAKPLLTGRDMEILSKAWKCMKTQPEIDYAKLAAECGMTNIRSASNAWSAIKKKLFPESAPSTPKKRKMAAAAPGDEEDYEQIRDEATPTKRARATPKAKSGSGGAAAQTRKRAAQEAMRVESQDESDGSDGTDVSGAI